MKILGVAIVQQGTPANILLSDFDLSSFGFFERGTVQEFLLFTSRTLAERVASGERQKVEQQGEYSSRERSSLVQDSRQFPMRASMSCKERLEETISAYQHNRLASTRELELSNQKVVAFVHARPEGVTGILITDLEYPLRAAFSILSKVLDEFLAKFAQSQWKTLEPSKTPQVWPELKGYVQKFQDPHAADPFLRVQKELDETKIVLHKTMESLLQRGEKLDDLVARSDMLSQQSKLFYTTAKKTNSCCSWT
ncbi:palmitoyltransferase [Gonapodya sp. JEL0774]|nr:palmitoyltransferase [Gonapodya sp. JEL0774]